MDNIDLKRKPAKRSNRDELLQLQKDDLIEKIIQLEAHNIQLKNILSKGIEVASETEGVRKKPFDFSKCHFRNILLRIMYFGWNYQGLAVQEDSNNTIEHYMFQALTKSCLIPDRESSQYHRCGRTDKGVSSFGQVISIKVRSKYSEEKQNLPENVNNEILYCKVLNRLLPEDIRAIAWMPIPIDKPDFSARFDCKGRLYKYYFPESNLNIAAMKEACKDLVGSHDFRNLCKMDVGNGVTEFIRDIISADVLPVENICNSGTSMYYLRIEGNAFLWHQIRCIFGVLLLIGQNKESINIIKELLDVGKHPRKPQYSMALDVPLNLFHCHYELDESSYWIYDHNELKTVIGKLQSFWTLHSVKSTMIQDCLNSLEEEYSKIPEKGQTDRSDGTLERDSVMLHTDCLLQGVKAKNYKPLLERDTCSSLEEKIEYYRKKRKLDSHEPNPVEQ